MTLSPIQKPLKLFSPLTVSLGASLIGAAISWGIHVGRTEALEKELALVRAELSIHEKQERNEDVFRKLEMQMNEMIHLLTHIEASAAAR